MTDAEFVRARRPEQKQQRREAILTAAQALGMESGVRNVTLGGVAQAVGLAKSNVVRYFGTREEIFLELAAGAWEEWAEAVVARLESAPDPAADVVDALAETLTDRPFFCDLLSHTTTTLEHNISLEAARTFKYAAMGVVSWLGGEVARVHPGLTEEEGTEVVSAAAALAGTIYPIARPSPVLTELYAQDPDLAATCPRLLPTLHRVLAALVLGLPALRTDER